MEIQEFRARNDDCARNVPFPLRDATGVCSSDECSDLIFISIC